jgi:hypothetical protein
LVIWNNKPAASDLRFKDSLWKKIAYFPMQKSEVFRALSSSENGLSAEAVAELLKRGKNQIAEHGKISLIS